jgi:hypothetical protein
VRARISGAYSAAGLSRETTCELEGRVDGIRALAAELGDGADDDVLAQAFTAPRRRPADANRRHLRPPRLERRERAKDCWRPTRSGRAPSSSARPVARCSSRRSSVTCSTAFPRPRRRARPPWRDGSPTAPSTPTRRSTKASGGFPAAAVFCCARGAGNSGATGLRATRGSTESASRRRRRRCSPAVRAAVARRCEGRRAAVLLKRRAGLRRGRRHGA